eukprot:c45505_g1_i1.p1 GENE.c45505_g1_i1~~c45505_g1_i1.p1  ORF type:complete len:332 (+),score=41.70 c45505_g1_i1:70-1065(+)
MTTSLREYKLNDTTMLKSLTSTLASITKRLVIRKRPSVIRPAKQEPLPSEDPLSRPFVILGLTSQPASKNVERHRKSSNPFVNFSTSLPKIHDKPSSAAEQAYHNRHRPSIGLQARSEMIEDCRQDVTEILIRTGTKQLVRGDRIFLQQLCSRQEMFLICDPDWLNHPIIYASPGFCDLVQYSLEELEGRNPKVLQTKPKRSTGGAQDQAEEEELSAANHESLERLRAWLALQLRDPVVATMMNFKKDGSVFANSFFITAFLNQRDRLTYLVGVYNPSATSETPVPHDMLRFREEQLNSTTKDLWTSIMPEPGRRWSMDKSRRSGNSFLIQ